MMKKLAITKQTEQEFAYVDSIIAAHTNSAIAKVNAESLQTYWEIGQYISWKLKSSQWGSHVVGELADFLKRQNPARRGYSKRNLYNMVSFFDTYSVPEFTVQIANLHLDEFVQSQTAQIFEAEFVSKLDLYLEALDRDYKRPNENPSVGIILCPSADKSEVEYTLSRSLSPTMVAEYRRLLVPVDVMQRSLAEYCEYLKKEFSNTGKTEDR